MKLHEYWLGLHPLDWEFCFMPVQTYKNFITEQYHKNPAFYNISAGSIEKVTKGVSKLNRLHIPQRLPLELVGQVGNAVAPAVILRKLVNDFLHRVAGTHDV